MGAFIFSRAHLKGLIPGSIAADAPFPLGDEDLEELYRTNGRLSLPEEQDLAASLPEVSLLPTPSQYREHLVRIRAAEETFQTALKGLPEGFDLHRTRWNTGDAKRQEADWAAVLALSEALAQTPKLEKWMRDAVAQINRSDLFRYDWEKLLRVLGEALLQEEKLRPWGAAKVSDGNPGCSWSLRKAALQGIRTALQEKGRLSFWIRRGHPEWRDTLDAVLVNGRRLQTPEDCDLALLSLYAARLSAELSQLWGKLLMPLGLPVPSPDMILPEAARHREQFVQCLEYVKAYKGIAALAADCGLADYAREVPLPFTEASVTRIQGALDTLGALAHAGKAWWILLKEREGIRSAQAALELGRTAQLAKTCCGRLRKQTRSGMTRRTAASGICARSGRSTSCAGYCCRRSSLRRPDGRRRSGAEKASMAWMRRPRGCVRPGARSSSAASWQTSTRRTQMTWRPGGRLSTTA